MSVLEEVPSGAVIECLARSGRLAVVRAGVECEARVMSRSASGAPVVAGSSDDGVVGVASGRLAVPAAAWSRLLFIASYAVSVVVGTVLIHTEDSAGRVHSVGIAAGFLAAVSLVATVGYLAVMAHLHVVPTGYNPIRHAVSDYGVGRYRSLFNTALYLSSVAVLALDFALIEGVGSPPLATRYFIYLLLIPLARIGMTLFPTNLEGQKLTRIGRLHYLCAIAAFTLTYMTISGMTPALRALDPTGWARAPLGGTAWIVAPALALVVVTMIRPLRRIFGLFERTFLLATNLWFALAAALLISHMT